jgi:inorganic triphosphatase YgiF
MKKEIIEDIINALIKITVFEYKNAKDGRLIDCSYKNHYTTNAVIKNCQALCLHDYSYDILRDQAFASIYESIVKMANNYTEDELILIYSDIHTKKQTITNQFLTGVYKKSVFSVKAALSGYRRNGKGGGMIPAATFVELLEENLTNEAIDEDQALDIVFFLQWFESNKEKFLTPKQLEFLENPVDKANKYTYKKRIYENTMRAYKQEFDNCDNDRQNLLDSQIRTLENILDAEDFATAYLKNRNKAVIIDAMTDMDLEILKAFNLGYRNYNKVLKPMRVALYHKLNNIYALLEK